jgi:hypothetical protein
VSDKPLKTCKHHIYPQFNTPTATGIGARPQDNMGARDSSDNVPQVQGIAVRNRIVSRALFKFREN